MAIDRPRVADVLGKAMSTGGVMQEEETYIVDWQFDNLQPDGSRIHCFCHLYPTGPPLGSQIPFTAMTLLMHC